MHAKLELAVIIKKTKECEGEPKKTRKMFVGEVLAVHKMLNQTYLKRHTLK